MDAALLGKLSCAEENIVSAVLDDDGDLAAYDFTWTSLLDEISQASGGMDDATLAFAHNVVNRVSTFVDCCLSLSSVSPPSFPILDHGARPHSPFLVTSFIPEACTWLLKNIANPYPSSEFKASLAQQHSSTVSAVSSWFASARRRIGWTALCRDSFRSCRADAVDAAYRVLVKEDADRRVGPEITHAFVAIKVAAEDFCTSSTKNIFACNLDTVVRDISEEKMITQCHPSPDLSRPSSPMPLFDGYITDGRKEEIVALIPGCKRRLSCLEPVPTSDSTAPARPMKRLCTSYSSSNGYLRSSSATGGPSDKVSRDRITSDSVRGTQSVYPASHRKRLSDPSLSESLQCSVARSHPDTLLDPLPLLMESKQSIDEWFKANFDSLFAFPPPVDVVEPDLSTQWEVELFDNYKIPENSEETLVPPAGDHRLSYTGSTPLGDVLQSLESDESFVTPEIMHPYTMPSISEPLPQDLALLPDLSQFIDWAALLNDVSESSCHSIFSQPYFDSQEIGLSMLQSPQIWTTVAS